MQKNYIVLKLIQLTKCAQNCFGENGPLGVKQPTLEVVFKKL
jgi:hypothetical protein